MNEILRLSDFGPDHPDIGPDFSVVAGREALQHIVDLADTTQFLVDDRDDDDPRLLIPGATSSTPGARATRMTSGCSRA